MPSRSPLAPDTFPEMPIVPGVRLGATSAGIRYKGRTDLLLVELDPGTTVAGVLTRSQTASAPVEWCRTALPQGRARAIVVNSGNANAFTGKAGQLTVDRTVRQAAALYGCRPEEVFVSSTGVIGEPIDPEIIPRALEAMKGRGEPETWSEAASAIMTTDTFPKAATRTARIGESTVRLNGIVKGSGMIAPDMATMLGYLFTDAAIPANVLQTLLSSAVDRTFNCITVDSDTSTSDTVLLCATGQTTHLAVTASTDEHLQDFRRALDEVCLDLAHQVVRDGEGATKFVTLRVDGAVSDASARRIGLAVANSPLVKTAIAGEDANWGRIVMAIGKAGEKADRDRLSISIGGIEVARGGQVVEGYDETPVVEHMKGREIEIAFDVGVGRGKAVVWTCDLTHGYIDINGSYRS